MPRYKFFEVKQ